MKDFIDMNYPKFTETFTESQSSINEFSFTYNSSQHPRFQILMKDYTNLHITEILGDLSF